MIIWHIIYDDINKLSKLNVYNIHKPEMFIKLPLKK